MSTKDKEIKQGAGKSQVISWKDLGANDDGKAVDVSSAHERTIQFSGVFQGATIRLEGSIDGENFHTLSDPQGNGLNKSSPSLETVMESVNWIRPVVAGGNKDTKLNVYLLIKFER